MASTTLVVSALDPACNFCTSSPMPDSPALRASGNSRLSIRYCLSADRSRPEWSLRNLRRYSYSDGVTGGLSQAYWKYSDVGLSDGDQADFRELVGDDVLVERLHDVFV